MKRLNRFLWLIVTIIFIILVFVSQIKVKTNIKAFDGILNLSKWDFSQNGEVKLQGKWNLYYGELLKPENIKTRTTNIYYNIPGRLSDQVSEKKQGYMTLNLKIYVPKDEIYGIYFNSLFTSSDIWVNGVHLDGHGRVGKNSLDEKPIYRPMYIFFPSENKEVNITIHTSTFRDLEPSLGAATFGTEQQIMNINYKNVGLDGIIIGILLSMGILSFGFYFSKPRQKRNIYFSSICNLMVLRCLVLNSRLLVEFYPNMPYEVLSKTAAITFYLSVTFYILFLNDIFNNKIIIKNMAIVFGTVFTALCIFTNNTVYDRTGLYAQVIVAFFGVYLLIFFIKEIYNKNFNAEKNFFPFVVIWLTVLNDILVNNAVLFNPYFVFYGVIVFITVESINIVDDYLESHKKLQYLNRDGLTSLYNNKYIKELISTELNHNSNSNKKGQFSLLMIDIDDFKLINDMLGHMIGDKVIIDVASILHEIIEDKGYVGRFGGDEFIIVLPKTAEKDALGIAEEIVKKIETLNEKYKNYKISLSIGVYENDTNDLTQCISKVDSYMYKAKISGKNCIVSGQI